MCFPNSSPASAVLGSALLPAVMMLRPLPRLPLWSVLLIGAG
jgi:hypothetical protein